MSKSAWLVLAASLWLVLGLFVGVLLFNSVTVKQALNMRAARQHIQKISSALLSSPERTGIRLSAFTGGECGSLLVHGSCATPEVAKAVRAEVEASNPPVETLFHFEIIGPDSYEQLRLDPILPRK